MLRLIAGVAIGLLAAGAVVLVCFGEAVAALLKWWANRF